MEKIGIFGGSFNPPHVGHIRAAEYAAEALGLTRVLLIPLIRCPTSSCLLPRRSSGWP